MAQGSAYDNLNLHQRIKARQSDYEDRRRQYDDQRQVIVELLRPDLVKGTVGTKTDGAFEGSRIIEGTGPHAALTWQQGFMGNMISRKAEWFRDRLEEPPVWTGVKFKGNDEVNAYCQDVTDHMTRVYQRSNYYDVMPQFVLDGGTVGSPVMLYERDIVNDRIICKVPDYAAVWLDKDIFGYDNAVHVMWEWTAIEAEQFFGYDALPKSVQDQLRNGHHYGKTQYLQVIYGAGDRIYKGLDEIPQTHPWLEYFICLAAADATEQKVLKPLHKGPGYFSRPFSTWHYHRNWHEVYGRTMAWWAIYDIRGHNAMWEALFGEAELSVRPATWALGTLRGLLDLGPGGGNYARNAQEYGMPPQYIERKTQYGIAIDFADRLKESIQRHFHYDLFMLVNQIVANKAQPETAYALMRAESEKTGQLAPQVETYENQVLSNSHDVFMDYEVMAEPAYPWGRLPEPPEIVQEYSDGRIDPQFIGLLSMAQVRDREVLKQYRAIGTVELFFNADPRVVNKVRWDQALERFLEAQDFAQADIVPQEEYEAMLQAMEQRAQQQELAENAPKMAQAAKALQGKTEKGSPLSLLTGQRS